MTGSTHIAVGLTVGIGISILMASPLPAALAITTAVTAGSLLPDIDTASSKLGRKIAPVSWIIRIFIGHRQMFHSLTFWAAICGILLFILPNATQLIWAGAAGVFSHLLLDMLNPSGVPLLWPLPKRFVIANLQCCGVVDYLLTIAFAIITAVLGWYYCQSVGIRF